MKYLVLFLLVCTFLIWGCSDDTGTGLDCTPGAVCNDGNPNTSGDRFDADCVCEGILNTGFDLGSNLLADVAGRLFNEAGQPLEGVTVTVGSKSATTDELGVFRIDNATVKENLGYVKAERAGYFPGSRSFLPTEGINRINFRLLLKHAAGSVDANVGGMVQSEGVKIDFTGGGFMKSGTAYTGAVHVAMNFIDPMSENFDEEMPGTLLGVQEGNGKVLTSFGMVAVELTDNSGAGIDLAEGTTAEMRFPVPSSMLSSAPAQIDLWYFDESGGYWVSEGKATLEGGEYVGQVSHFSFWNCDVPTDYIILDGQVVDGSGSGVQGVVVTITSGIFGSRSDWTDSEGYFGGQVPSGEVLSITLNAPCAWGPQQVYTAQIGPYFSNTVLNPIMVTIPENTEVSGAVEDCEGNPPASGYVIANGQVYYLTNGNFSFTTCGSITITAYNTSEGWEAGTPQNISLTGGAQDVGTLTACGGAQTGSFTDPRDGQTYQTVQIGSQEWLAENLNYDTGSSLCYDYNSGNCDTYGRLYDWPTALSGCPVGWHLPTDAEWTQLTVFLGGADSAGLKMKEPGLTHWASPNTGAMNESGFTGLPGGYIAGDFANLSYVGFWWSATEYDGITAWHRYLNYYSADLFRSSDSKETGLSVRCVRD